MSYVWGAWGGCAALLALYGWRLAARSRSLRHALEREARP
jgi:hypothetical protein